MSRFAVTLFVSATLLFACQPMIARMIVPPLYPKSVNGYIRKVLPEEHLRQITREEIGLGVGLIGALTALLLPW